VSPSRNDVGKSLRSNVLLYLDVSSPPIVLEVYAQLVSSADGSS
jgi:hypothetical protein